MTRITQRLIAIGFLCLMSSAAFAQRDPLYLTAGDQSTIWVVQQGAILTNWSATTSGQYPIAVSGDVRTLGINGASDPGAQYSLGGVFTGVSYLPPFNPNGDNIFDGTTDGVYNYLVGFESGNVYRTDRGWQNPSVIFSAQTAANIRQGLGAVGISFDPTNFSLWIAYFQSGTVSDFAMDGTLLSSFSTGLSNEGALAFDPGDQSVWVFDRGTSATTPTFSQYSTSGVLLGQTLIPELVGQNILGGEFDEPVTVNPGPPTTTPEPGAVILVLTGIVAVGAGRRLGDRSRCLIAAPTA